MGFKPSSIYVVSAWPRTAKIAAGLVVVAAIVAGVVWYRHVPPVIDAEQAGAEGEQNAAEGRAAAEAAAPELERAEATPERTRPIRNERKVRRAETRERVRQVSVSPDADLPRLYWDSVRRARDAVDRARAGRDRDDGAKPGQRDAQP